MSPSDEAQLREADQFIEELRRSIHHGFGDVSTAKELLRTVLHREMWKDRVINMTDRRQTYAEFIRFVTEPPLEGLGTNIDTLDTLAHGDTGLENLLDRAVQRTSRNNQPVDIINGLKKPDGTSRAQALRRLRASRPDLHERVITGELSPHAAMIEAGYRKQTFTVPRDPESIAALVIRNFTTDQIEELIERLIPYLPIEKA